MVSSLPRHVAPVASGIPIGEDEGIIANHIACRLKNAGYPVAGIAQSSEEAIAQVEKSQPELILMDIQIQGGLARVLPLADSVTGIPVTNLYAPNSPSACGRRNANEIPAGIVVPGRDGTWFPVDGEIAPSLDSGTVVGCVITFRDATARQAQENEIRQQQKCRLSASVAHDFNNLLFVILGYAEELLLESQLTEGGWADLRKISKAAKSAANLTRQLLKFSRKEPFEKPCALQPHRISARRRQSSHPPRQSSHPDPATMPLAPNRQIQRNRRERRRIQLRVHEAVKRLH